MDTETEILTVQVAMGLATMFIVYNLNVWTSQPRWTRRWLKCKRFMLLVAGYILLGVAAVTLVLRHQILQLLLSALGAAPVGILGLLGAARAKRILAGEDPTLDGSPHFEEPYRPTKSEKWVFGIVVTAIVVLTILAWKNM